MNIKEDPFGEWYESQQKKIIAALGKKKDDETLDDSDILETKFLVDTPIKLFSFFKDSEMVDDEPNGKTRQMTYTFFFRNNEIALSKIVVRTRYLLSSDTIELMVQSYSDGGIEHVSKFILSQGDSLSLNQAIPFRKRNLYSKNTNICSVWSINDKTGEVVLGPYQDQVM